MVADSVEFLRANDLRVFLDAEHFFDGYQANPEFTLRILRAAEEAGAETLVLCDTNGGTLPYEVERIVADVLGGFETQVGVHFHNDSGCAVANSLAAVAAGRHPRPGLRQRLRRAGRQRRPLRRHPRPVPQAAGPAPSRPTASSCSPRWPTTSPSWSTSPPTPSSPSWARRSSPTRPACTPRPSPGGRDAYEHIVAGAGRQRHPVRGLGDGRPVDPGPQGGRAGSRARLAGHVLGARLAQAARVRGLPLRGGRRLARAAAAQRHRLGAARSSSSSPTGSSPTTASGPVHRGHGQGPGGHRADRGHRRGQRPGQRPGRGGAGGHRVPLPGARTASTWSTTGCGCSTRPRGPARSPGC